MTERQSTRPTPADSCPICGDPGAVPFLAKNGYAIVRCARCDVLHVSPMPPDEALRAHYEDPGYFSGEAEQGYSSYADVRKALLPHFRRRLGAIDGHTPSRGRLLDFGCAAGYFLELAKADGWQVAGVELSREMAEEAARALGVSIVATIESLPEASFDVVTGWEVVEHLPRPVAELGRLRSRLRPGGMLMLSTPNAGHWQAVREPEAWTAYRPPSHLVYFTAQTLEDALRGAGFERIAVRGVAPLPPLPGWVQRASAPLQEALATGKARPWPLALFAWRAIRVFGLGWQRIAHRRDDVSMTLEAVAFRPL